MAAKDAETEALANVAKVTLPKGPIIKASGGGGTIANEGTAGTI